MLWPLWLETLADCHELGNLCKGLVASLCNHTSEVWYWCGIVPDQHSVVGYKVLRNFYANCGESVQPLQSVKLIYQPCSRSRAAWTLTWLIELKMDLNHFLVISCGLTEYQPEVYSPLLTAAQKEKDPCLLLLRRRKLWWSLLKMLLSSRHTQPPVDCLWSLKHSFPG